MVNGESRREEYSLQEARKILSGVLYGILDVNSDVSLSFFELLGVTKERMRALEIPFGIFFDFSVKPPLKYRFHSALDRNNIIFFYTRVVNKQEQPWWKSDPIPEKNDDLIKIVVHDNYNEIVKDNKTDVILLLYKKNCDPCAEFYGQFEAVAKYFKDQKDVVFAKINLLDNDIEEDLEITQVPHMKFFAKNDKKAAEVGVLQILT